LLLSLVPGCDGSSRNKIKASGKQNDPLPSWHEGDVKHSVLQYVKNVTDAKSPDFIPAADRIATFDNDGTLWCEKPYVQELFMFYVAKKMAKEKPLLREKQPFKAAIYHDEDYFVKGGEKAVASLLFATHTGVTEEQFDISAREFFTSAVYPRLNVPINKIVYQPQIELLDYLRVNGFKTFICSGGTVEFVREISREFYGIPPEQVIGTSFQYVYTDSNRSIFRKPALGSFNDKEGKPVNIQLHIGRRPVFACGNVGGAGDIAMLSFSQQSKYHAFQLLINHDDEKREFAYSEKDNVSLQAAEKNHWKVVSMKRDWKKIFPD
jgi:hypothetical protein